MNNILFNNISIIVVFTIIVLGVLLYTFYNKIYTTKQNSSNPKVGMFNQFKLKLSSLIRLSLIGTVSTRVDTSDTTVVNVTDEELNSLLEVVFNEIGDTNMISVELLQSLGLYTSTVVNYLEQLGYIIF